MSSHRAAIKPNIRNERSCSRGGELHHAACKITSLLSVFTCILALWFESDLSIFSNTYTEWHNFKFGFQALFVQVRSPRVSNYFNHRTSVMLMTKSHRIQDLCNQSLKLQRWDTLCLQVTRSSGEWLGRSSFDWFDIMELFYSISP